MSQYTKKEKGKRFSPGFETIIDTTSELGRKVAEKSSFTSLARCDCWDCVDSECSSSCTDY
jgi:hypothetical protein